jgi:hypothetical protein
MRAALFTRSPDAHRRQRILPHGGISTVHADRAGDFNRAMRAISLARMRIHRFLK